MIINIPGSSIVSLSLWQWIEEITRNSISGNGNPMCLKCKHFDRTNQSMVISCTAFPEGIPEDILFGVISHDCPCSGDKGIIFEPLIQNISDDEYNS